MARVSLPLVDVHRSEFGLFRTICSCADCTANCRYVPGYLIPADLDRIKHSLECNEDFVAWAMEHLLASPGALVHSAGRAFRIPTLVPARSRMGACIFLTENDQCAIHAISPFGCAFFDAQMPPHEADRRSSRGLHAVLSAWVRQDEYAQIWTALDRAGLHAPSPEFARQQLQLARNPERRA